MNISKGDKVEVRFVTSPLDQRPNTFIFTIDRVGKFIGASSHDNSVFLLIGFTNNLANPWTIYEEQFSSTVKTNFQKLYYEMSDRYPQTIVTVMPSPN
jgi:hypothetical protein